MSRRSSIASELKVLCARSGFWFRVDEIDIYNGGSAHDLLDPAVQAKIAFRIKARGYDVVILDEAHERTLHVSHLSCSCT